MYTLKSIVRRSTSFGAAVAMAVAAVIPAVFPASSVYADALNPLTDRSLTLSSSNPGWSDKDGSGNATYATPNSGANGRQTGNTFKFKTSSDSTSEPVKAFTFQYCTSSAGSCTSPGNGAMDVANKTSNLDVVTSTPSELTPTAFGEIIDTLTGGTKPNAGRNYELQGTPALDNSEGNFAVLWNNGGTWEQSTGWSMAASDNQTDSPSPVAGVNNYITLTNATGGLDTPSFTEVKVVFFATNTNYITNPGAGAFFVKINDYNSDSIVDDTTLVDGGVTVANVMNQSIEIQTKVLETMDFSVGTVDPNTLDSTDGAAGGAGSGSELYLANGQEVHGPCDRILKGMTPGDQENILKMGNEQGEFSLETDKTYSTHSYWRLSSNSSAGATVYYSGVTLSNTVNDQIDAIGATKSQPLPGSEQFGLALDNGTNGNYAVDYSVERDTTPDPDKLYEWGVDNGKTGIHASVTTDVGGNASYHAPQLSPLIPTAEYGEGTGTVNNNFDGSGSDPINTKFAFDPNSNTIPVPIASESSQVVDCVTAKMRYIANIAATTPAGIYATKISYIAAPQY